MLNKERNERYIACVVLQKKHLRWKVRYDEHVVHGGRLMVCDVARCQVAALGHFISLFVCLVLPVSEQLRLGPWGRGQVDWQVPTARVRDCDAHHHMLQVDDVVVGVVGAAGRLVHRAHHVLRADGPAAGGKERERGGKREWEKEWERVGIIMTVVQHLFMGGGEVKMEYVRSNQNSSIRETDIFWPTCQ